MPCCANWIVINGERILKTDKCTHLDKYYFNKPPSNAKYRGGAACLHGSAHIWITSDIDKVTCPNCLDTIPLIWLNSTIKA